MKFIILTLFPEFFESVLKTSLLGKAIAKELVQVQLINFRNFATNKHAKVDDAPYGGGTGMILMVEPIVNALKSIKEDSFKILLTPRGFTYHQKMARKIFNENINKTVVLICGHYEGFDERIIHYCDISISIGNFILSSGEVASLTLLDSIARLVPGFMGNEDSLQKESFEEKENYIEYPQYTRPQIFDGLSVPDVLLSGDHKKIENFRKEKSIESIKKFQ